MKNILLFLFTALVITLSGVTSGYTSEINQTVTTYSNANVNVYVYEDVYIGTRHFIYVYEGDILIDVYEVEE